MHARFTSQNRADSLAVALRAGMQQFCPTLAQPVQSSVVGVSWGRGAAASSSQFGALRGCDMANNSKAGTAPQQPFGCRCCLLMSCCWVAG
jgi:hypothetical protein